MARVYSTRFAITHAGAPVPYTVPAGYKAVIRCLTGFNSSIVSTQYTQLVDDASGATLWQATLNPSTGYSAPSALSEARIVVEEGETVTLFPGSDCDMSIHGYLLDLP